MSGDEELFEQCYQLIHEDKMDDFFQIIKELSHTTKDGLNFYQSLIMIYLYHYIETKLGSVELLNDMQKTLYKFARYHPLRRNTYWHTRFYELLILVARDSSFETSFQYLDAVMNLYFAGLYLMIDCWYATEMHYELIVFVEQFIKLCKLHPSYEIQINNENTHELIRALLADMVYKCNYKSTADGTSDVIECFNRFSELFNIPIFSDDVLCTFYQLATWGHANFIKTLVSSPSTKAFFYNWVNDDPEKCDLWLIKCIEEKLDIIQFLCDWHPRMRSQAQHMLLVTSHELCIYEEDTLDQQNSVKRITWLWDSGVRFSNQIDSERFAFFIHTFIIKDTLTYNWSSIVSEFSDGTLYGFTGEQVAQYHYPRLYFEFQKRFVCKFLNEHYFISDSIVKYMISKLL
jgi:hypothetical protein